MKTPFRRLAWLALALSAILNIATAGAAESDILYDQRIPRQVFGATPPQADRNAMMKVMQALPMPCGVGESDSAHQSHELVFQRAMQGYRGRMRAEQVAGHILMTDRGISAAQMIAMVPMLGSMQTPEAVTVLRNLKRWSRVLASRFMSENVPTEQRELVLNGIERSLQNSLTATANRYRLSL